MNVLVDTSIWSLALRRKRVSKEEGEIVNQFSELISESRVKIIGPIRQELLSGVKDGGQFQTLQKRLSAFEDITIATQDYLRAAEMFNICRNKGIEGGHIDFLICSISESNHLAIFTTDSDFSHYAKFLPIRLFTAFF